MTLSPKISLFLCAALVLAVSNCGKNEQRSNPVSTNNNAQENAQPTRIGQHQYRILAGANTLTAAGNTLRGTGTVLFTTPSTRQNNRFSLTFELPNGGELSLYMNSNNELRTGVKLIFTRAGQTMRLQLERCATADGRFTGTDQSVALAELRLDASQRVTLEVDIHGHGHLQIIGNGRDTAPIGFRAVNGTFAGLALANANVLDFNVGESQVRD